MQINEIIYLLMCEINDLISSSFKSPARFLINSQKFTMFKNERRVFLYLKFAKFKILRLYINFKKNEI